MPENKEHDVPEGQLLVEDDEMEDAGGGILQLLKIVLPIVLLSLGGGGYLAYSQYSNLAEAAVSMGINFGFSEETEAEGPIEYGEFMTIDDLLINPAGSNGKRFLVVSIGVEAQNGGVLAELTQREIVVRDAILRLLSRRTADELGSIELRGEIKEEVISELNAILQKGEITRLYFTQYLLQ